MKGERREEGVEGKGVSFVLAVNTSSLKSLAETIANTAKNHYWAKYTVSVFFSTCEKMIYHHKSYSPASSADLDEVL